MAHTSAYFPLVSADLSASTRFGAGEILGGIDS
jgi:hypothetical protein